MPSLNSNDVEIIVRSKSDASGIDGAGKALKRLGGEIEKQQTLTQRLASEWQTFAGISVGAGLALRGLGGQMGRGITAANKYQAALTGLRSVASAFKQDANAAEKAAQELASDGLMTVAESATGLKNLLAAGFSLPQAIRLMERFKDSAAFGRQASLGFGEAVSSATEGIKNQNSILVDNAGVTKNLSLMLKEAGYSVNDLGRVSTDAGVRMALFRGIMKETNAQVGDADKLVNSAAGKQAMMAAETEKLYQQIGIALQPALLTFLQTVTPIIQGVSGWVSENQQLTSTVLIGAGVILGLIATMGALATAIKTTQTVVSVFGPTAVASFGKARAGFLSFKNLVRVPLVMPAIGVAAALAAIALVLDKYRAMQNEIRNTQAAIDSKMSSDRAALERINKAWKQGRISDSQYKKLVANAYSGTPAYATGTEYARGGLARVGEHGPEIVELPKGSKVHNASATQQMSTGRSAPSIVIENFNSYSETDNQKFLSDLGWRLEIAR